MHHPLTQAAVADGIAMVVVFGFSAGFRNSSFYDAYWSVAPPCLGLGWWWMLGQSLEPRAWMAITIVCCWAIRLTMNWAHGWTGLQHQDWRYGNLQRQLGALYWPVSFSGIHLMPTLLVFLGCLPLYFVVAAPSAPLNLLDGLAVGVAVAAIWIETQADLELHRFRRQRESARDVLTTGVWRWCRHPNYLGEIGFWLALALFAGAAGVASVWAYAGVLAMLVLFEFISIPMIEKKLVEAKPEYRAYCQRTFRLLPFSALRN